ncbi:MAG TPA: M28 family peptidase [Gemmatimonadaceae bacterium]
MRSVLAAGFAAGIIATLMACGPKTTVATMATPTVVGAPASQSALTVGQPLDPTIGLVRDTIVDAILPLIDPAHIRHTDSTLVTFGTRNTLSDTLSSTHGIGAARHWIHSQFDDDSRACGGCLKVSYYEKMNNFTVRNGRDTTHLSANVVDVVAWLPGRDTTHVVVMTGHYDSCICSLGGTYDSTATAPGADDDGSGTSAIMELARVFSQRFPHGLNESVIFAAVGAEEQGLNGSTQLAQHLHDAGYKVIAGMTDDIVGNVTAEDGTVDSTSMRIFAADPDNSPSRELGRFAWALQRSYLPNFEVLPVWRLDRIGRGGDHEPYVDLGDAGLRFTERLENYNRQHLPTDDFSHVNFGYIANVARVNAMTVASLASAPVTPTGARATRQGRAPATGTAGAAAPSSGGQAWTLSWEPSPGATHYELLLRRTTSPTWDRVVTLGDITSCMLHQQLDDEWAGIRAVGANGERSMVASLPAPNPPRGAPRAPRPATPAARPAQPAGTPPSCGA